MWWDKNSVASEEKTTGFKERIIDKSVVNKLKYDETKRAKKIVSAAVKEASDNLITDMEDYRSSKVMLEATEKSVTDNKNVVGPGCNRWRR